MSKTYLPYEPDQQLLLPAALQEWPGLADRRHGLGVRGSSALYYSRISYTLSNVEPPKTGGLQPPVWAIVLLAGIGAALAGLGLTALRRRPQR